MTIFITQLLQQYEKLAGNKQNSNQPRNQEAMSHKNNEKA